MSAPLSVLWDITSRCNLRCAHCLGASGEPAAGELGIGEIESTIDQLDDLKVFSITFCGGEPLVHPAIIRILEYATRRSIGLKISSNGLLVDEALLGRLEPCNVCSFQISLDGTEPTHDTLRGQAGAYRKAVKAIELLVAAGYDTTVAPVITRKTIAELGHVLEVAADLGASTFRPSIFVPTGRGARNNTQLAVSKEELRACYEGLFEKVDRYAGRIRVELSNVYPGLGDEPAEVGGPCHDGDGVGCSAGRTQVVIRSNGIVAPCSFLYDFPAGDLRKNTLREIWHGSAVLRSLRALERRHLKGKCRECKFLPARCGGGCRAAANALSGDLYAEDPYCWA